MVKINFKILIFLVLLFFISTRLVNLTILPIFNDEAIYLDWGQRMIHAPGAAFYSLYDGKQPLLMWIFGIANDIIADPLIAGRLVSVFFSGLTVLGIYLLSDFFLSFPFRFLAPLIYLGMPIFAFFDRQALMEAAISCINVWSLYFLLKFIQKREYRWALALGIISGAGLFIKSNTVIFLISAILILIYFIINQKKYKEKEKIFWGLSLIIFITFLIIFPLILASDAKNIITMGNRFNLTVNELISIPLVKWWENLKAFVAISFWHLTPPVFILEIFGVILIAKKKYYRVFLTWFSLGLIIAILTVRNLSPRYLVSLLPLISILVAFIFQNIFKTQRKLGYLTLLLLGIPLYITALLIFKPLDYFNLLNKFNPQFSQKSEYVTGNPSGYGINQVRQWLEEKSVIAPIYVGVRVDAGNPENALIAYYYKNDKIRVLYFDKRLIPPTSTISNLNFDRPLYFVSRSEQLAGLEDYLREEVKFYKPEGKSWFGVYRFENFK